jgi:hypothetical protein
MVKSVDVNDLSVRKAAASPEPLPDRRPAKDARSSSEPKDTCTTTPSSSIMGTPLGKASTPAPLKRILTPPPLRDTRESSAGSESESSSGSSSGSSDDSKMMRPPASAARIGRCGRRRRAARRSSSGSLGFATSSPLSSSYFGTATCRALICWAPTPIGSFWTPLDPQQGNAYLPSAAAPRRIRRRRLISLAGGGILCLLCANEFWLFSHRLAFGGSRWCSPFVPHASSVDGGTAFSTIDRLYRSLENRRRIRKGMALPVTSRCQWGGFPEFCALAQWLNLRVWCFVEFLDKSVKLLCEPIGSRKATPISLLWCGGCHYDACRLSTHQLNESLL